MPRRNRRLQPRLKRIRIRVPEAVIDYLPDQDDIYPGILRCAAEWKSPWRLQANQGQKQFIK